MQDRKNIVTTLQGKGKATAKLLAEFAEQFSMWMVDKDRDKGSDIDYLDEWFYKEKKADDYNLFMGLCEELSQWGYHTSPNPAKSPLTLNAAEVSPSKISFFIAYFNLYANYLNQRKTFIEPGLSLQKITADIDECRRVMQEAKMVYQWRDIAHKLRRKACEMAPQQYHEILLVNHLNAQALLIIDELMLESGTQLNAETCELRVSIEKEYLQELVDFIKQHKGPKNLYECLYFKDYQDSSHLSFDEFRNVYIHQKKLPEFKNSLQVMKNSDEQLRVGLKAPENTTVKTIGFFPADRGLEELITPLPLETHEKIALRNSLVRIANDCDLTQEATLDAITKAQDWIWLDALKNGDAPLIFLLITIKKKNPHWRPDESITGTGKNALMLTVMHGHVEATLLLLKAGASCHYIIASAGFNNQAQGRYSVSDALTSLKNRAGEKSLVYQSMLGILSNVQPRPGVRMQKTS